MIRSEITEETPFDLKRKGEFDRALCAYAEEYKRNAQESKYVARLCFEQMFDIILLKCLREQRRFENNASLVASLESEMRSVFKEMKIADEIDFKEYFARSRRKLLPRGRGKSAFSVDRNLLLQPKE